MWEKPERQWLAAYEWLQITAYQLLGKRYTRQDGLIAPVPGAKLTRGQSLFCLLFPLFAIVGVMVALATVWVYTYVQFFSHIEPSTYYWNAPAWHIALQVILIALPLLASPAYFDVRRALRLLTELSHHPPEQTPHQDREWKRPQ